MKMRPLLKAIVAHCGPSFQRLNYQISGVLRLLNRDLNFERMASGSLT